MTRQSRNDDALARMRAANPSSATALREELTDAELSLAMQRAIAVGESPSQPIPTGDRAAREHDPRTRPAANGVFSQHRRASLGLGGLACAAVVAALILLGGGSVRDGGHPAFAAAAVEVAEANPRLLVTAPGWSVRHAYGFEVDSGSMIFGDGAHHLTFDWYPARYYRSYLRDRRQVGAVAHSTILGHRATTVRYRRSPVSEPGLDYETLLSPWGGVAIGVRGIAASRREYQTILHSLRRVDVDTWLSAMPPEVVQPDALDATVRQMLSGVPLPPDFDPGTLPDASLVTDRYRLGTAVTGAVTCGWLENWVAAARDHDVTGAGEAARGLGGARNWPVLLSMAREKGWKGDQLPPNGNGWASTILQVARETGKGRLSQGSGIYRSTRNGRFIEEGPGWSQKFGCKAHYRRQLKTPRTLREIKRGDPILTLSR